MRKQRAKSEPQVSSAERLDVYRTMFSLNRAFYFAVQRLEELASLLGPQSLKDLRGLTQEVQTQINHRVLGRLHSIEMEDWAQFGRVRIAMEERLRGLEGIKTAGKSRKAGIQKRK